MIYASGYFGLGDNIYQYPFIEKLSKQHNEIFIDTPFPELFSTIHNVRFCNRRTSLKTQSKNMDKYSRSFWVTPPYSTPDIHFSYHRGRKMGLSVIQSFSRDAGVTIDDFSIPIQDKWIDDAKSWIPKTDRKICVLKLPTIRKEWPNPSRNPPMGYFHKIVDEFRKDLYFVCLADNTGDEYFPEEPPKVDKMYEHGEIPWETILGLIHLSDIVICYPSFFLPASIALRAKCFCVYGGSVGNKFLVDSIMDLSKYDFIEPDPMCNCFATKHNCNKQIDTQLMIDKIHTLLEN